MGALACRMCAAPLKIDPDGVFAMCPYCGTTYTLPLEDETDEERMIRSQPVLEKAKMYLKDGRFEDAAESFERVLDIDHSIGEAYLGKGLAQLSVKDIHGLYGIRRQALQNYYIKKALIFCRGDIKAELYKALGMKMRNSWKDISVKQWRSEVMSVRKSFFRDLRALYADNDECRNKNIEKIEGEYERSSEELNAAIEKCEKDIADLRDNMQKENSFDNIIECNNKLVELRHKKEELESRRSIIDSRRNSEILNAAENFSAASKMIGSRGFMELTLKYQIPDCVHDENESIVDKVYDILLSEYEYLSLSEIMSRDLCRGQSERRVEAAVKKLLIDKRIISAVIDGIECYAPSDMDGIR